jgi:hypothetical protein
MLHAAVMKEIGIMAKIGTTFPALMGRSLTKYVDQILHIIDLLPINGLHW